jgi:hypothetical protein
MSETCGLAHAFTPQSGQVYFVLLAVFFLRFAASSLAERLVTAGGSAVFSNVSPGAAYAHDPDGYGTVRHRAGSFGPGRGHWIRST